MYDPIDTDVLLHRIDFELRHSPADVQAFCDRMNAYALTHDHTDVDY